MPKLLITPFLAALCAISLAPAFAQSAAPAPQLEYRSAFDGYRSFAQEEVQPWKQTNDTVRDIGGWRAYAREISAAQDSKESSPAKSADPQSPAAAQQPVDPHAGHHKP